MDNRVTCVETDVENGSLHVYNDSAEAVFINNAEDNTQRQAAQADIPGVPRQHNCA
jgi:hypothetical protein